MQDRLVTVLYNNEIADGIYELKLAYKEQVETIKGGQFVHIALRDKSKILRRPFCICDFDIKEQTITVVYAVVGEGTKNLSLTKKGEKLEALFPLGNGFSCDGLEKIALVGGGMGSAVLPAIATASKDKKFYTYLGFGDKSKVILEDVMKDKSVLTRVCTDNGSYGEKGFVTDALKQDLENINFDAIFCCGPSIMYKTLSKMTDIPIYVSLEQRMGCGIGACLVCACKIKRNGSEEYLRVCADGPVFKLDEVVL